MSPKALSLHEKKQESIFSFSIFHVFPPIVERNGAREGCQKIGNLMEGASGTDLTFTLNTLLGANTVQEKFN